MPIPILKQGDVLIVSVQTAVSDADWVQVQHDLASQIGSRHAHWVILDVTALDVVDSFAARTLRTIAQTSRLRGAEFILVGLQPDVAFSMVQLGMASRLEGIETCLDLEAALDLMAQRRERRHGR